MMVFLLSSGLWPSVSPAAKSEPPGATPSGPPDEIQAPLYSPPKKLVPRARIGGELRGADQTDPEAQAIVPDHVAFTYEKSPTVNWYISKPTTHKVTFTLTDIRLIHPVFEKQIPTPKEAGIHSVNLSDLGVTLE